MPNAPKTPTRTIRVADDLWKAVQVKAAAERITVTKIILDALEAYVGPLNSTVSEEPDTVLPPAEPYIRYNPQTD
jgi:hypothetical protein